MSITRDFIPHNFIIYVCLALVFAISSCRSSRDISSSRLKPVSTEKLLDRAQENAFNFNNLTIRRINVQFSNDDTRTSFRASIKAIKDDKILASVSKLNIPVGRILLTPDDVTYVNYIDRNYFQGDYSFLGSMLNFNLDFNVVQALISNPLHNSKTIAEIDPDQFESGIENGKYILRSTSKSSKQYAGSNNFWLRNKKKKSTVTDSGFQFQTLMFNSNNFVLEKMIMNKPDEDQRLEVMFSDFQKVDNYDYPGTIDVVFMSKDEKTELNFKLRGFSTEMQDALEIKIPERYQRIRVR